MTEKIDTTDLELKLLALATNMLDPAHMQAISLWAMHQQSVAYQELTQPANILTLLNKLEEQRETIEANTNLCVKRVADLTRERNAALVRLAAMEAQEPVAWRKLKPDNNWALLHQNVGWKDPSGIEPLYAAAGASPQPSQAQAALDAIFWYYENCNDSGTSVIAFRNMVDHVVKMRPSLEPKHD